MLHRSTLQQLLILLHSIVESSQKSQSDLIYLDFKKAFDSVAHNELLFKLWRMGITDNTWKWLLAYLSNRSQCVSINSSISSALPVVSGVPQGSILGPLLFLIYINNLPDVPSCSQVLLFAKCFKTISSVCDSMRLQDDLNKLSEWSDTWSLPFNVQKCCVLSVRPTQHLSYFSFFYHLNNTQLTNKTAHSDLSVTLTSDLRWRDHIVSGVSRGGGSGCLSTPLALALALRHDKTYSA